MSLKGRPKSRLGRSVVALTCVTGLCAVELSGGLSGVASAAEPSPTLYWTVDPPTLGQTHSPNPVTGETGVPTTITPQLATNNDLANNPAPTGTVTFTDSLGIINGHCNNEPASPYNLDLSTATCTTTFPNSTTGDDVLTATYSGDSKNRSTSGTQSITFLGTPTPEGASTLLLPASAAVVGLGVLLVVGRRRRRIHSR